MRKIEMTVGNLIKRAQKEFIVQLNMVKSGVMDFTGRVNEPYLNVGRIINERKKNTEVFCARRTG